MLKLLIYEDDLNLLSKMKSLMSSISIFHEVKIVNDEKSCLKLIKDEYFDMFILKINDIKFKESLLKAMPDIVNCPLLCTNENIEMEEFFRCSRIEVEKNRFNLLSLLSVLSDLIPKDVLQANDQLIEEYLPVKLSILRKIKTTPCDVYIKLGSEKYIKIINQSEEIQPFFLDRYEAKSVEQFYIRKIDFYRCSDELFSNTMPKAENFEVKADYYSQSNQVIMSIISEIGINENVVKLADELVESAVSELKDSNLSNLLDSFKNSKDRYIYDHSVLTSVFALALCEKFEWRNRQLMQKIAFAAIFHDFGFVDAKLALFESNPKNNPNLTKEQRNEILSHPQKIVETLSLNKTVSTEVLSMITKHHECHGEESYPAMLSSGSLSVLECVFIVAHEFANELYKIAFREDKLQKAIDNVMEFSNTGNLKQVRAVFMTVIDEKFQLSKK